MRAAGEPPRGSARASAWALTIALAGCSEPALVPTEAESEPASEPPDPHADAKQRLADFEAEQHATIDLERRPASDHRFGADPVRVIELPAASGAARFAGLLRGRDRLVLLDDEGATLAELPTVHLPSGLALAPDRRTLAIVGVGEPTLQLVELDAGRASELRRHDLGEAALAPRDLVFAASRLWILDEGSGVLHELDGPREAAVIRSAPHCRGGIELRVVDEFLLTNCLLDHTLRIDELAPGEPPRERARVVHEGPIWAFDVARERTGALVLALAGVEDHPLERRDGGFGYIDSFAFLARFDPASGQLERAAAINVSELGLVTPKVIHLTLAPTLDAGWTLDLTGYASAERLRLHGSRDAVGEVERFAWLPGSQSLIHVAQPTSTYLAADPLLDAWLIARADAPPTRVAIPDPSDDRSFDERLGEALVFTSAMAPDNSSEGPRSRFTCETCHFEGRGDGRTHWTGRVDAQGRRVHATSKPLLGLFESRPYFSRALDRTLARMVDAEFRVANRHSPRDAWAPLAEQDLAWLATLPGWPGHAIEGEALRRALMAFVIRWTMPSNPRARTRANAGLREFTELEARGAERFRERCEGCHQARLLVDDPSTRVPFERWPELVLSEAGPITWASEVYAATAIEPWVHPEGARVPSLRRLHLEGPYFTNGAATSVAALVAGVRVRSDNRVDHDLADAPGQPLPPDEQQALLEFLRLL